MRRDLGLFNIGRVIETEVAQGHLTTKGRDMTTFIIERNIPGASELTQDQLSEIAATSNTVVDDLGVPYTWHHSYVAGDKVYCVHETDDIETIREHARTAGFPADVVVELATTIGPETAND